MDEASASYTGISIDPFEGILGPKRFYGFFGFLGSNNEKNLNKHSVANA